MGLFNTINKLARLERVTNENINLGLSMQEAASAYDEIYTLESSVPFPADQVPVVTLEGHGPTKCGVTGDILGIFMERNNLHDIEEAMDIIAKENDLKLEDMCLILDSSSDFKRAIREAKEDKDLERKDARVKEISRVAYLTQCMNTGKVAVAKEPDVVQVDFNDDNIATIEKNTCNIGTGYDDLRTDWKVG